MPITTAYANATLDHQTGKTAMTLAPFYVGLSSTTPTIAGTGATEPSGGNYARVQVSGASWAAAAAGATSNTVAINFGAATADWVSGANLTYGVLYSAATGGVMQGFGLLGTPKNCLNGDTISIAIGDLDLTLA